MKKAVHINQRGAQNSGKNGAKFKAYWWEAAICALVFSPVVMQLKDTQPWIVPVAMSAGAVIVLSKDSLISTLVSKWEGLKSQPQTAKTSTQK
jgi:hypothetical protein